MTPKLPTHEIQVGAIIGIRVWFTRFNELHSSVGQHTKWTPGLKRVARRETKDRHGACYECRGTAPCTLNRQDSAVPYGTLQCGLHATPDIKYFPSHVPPYYSGNTGFRVVFGLVRLFGRVVEGHYGWRAEFAEVHALCDEVPSNNFTRCNDSTLITLAAIYDVPILYLEELSLQATKIGEKPCP